ncbi:hypothetical protein M0208_17355 [Sphingomonas sp. SUN019]|uniref:hypothetical protein n=1 Tax=Sphingomonas sp. SUN019 TaxID=2937788 RepID=UPI002164A1DB|nr:hypothetical protein [Sphingomonas sp. SUN019]UVO52191.1 hypothetical protein M0208_17355 [Sphingomonas sp. SUN019]
MKPLEAIAIFALIGSSPALAEGGRSFWNFSFGQGIGEYSTGTWDSPTGGALLVNCRTTDGTASIMTQIDGKEPPANSAITLTTSSRRGSHEMRFATDARGGIELGKSARSKQLRELWSNLRQGDIVTIRYADGQSSVQSLVGAAKVLGPRPCPA